MPRGAPSGRRSGPAACESLVGKRTSSAPPRTGRARYRLGKHPLAPCARNRSPRNVCFLSFQTLHASVNFVFRKYLEANLSDFQLLPNSRASVQASSTLLPSAVPSPSLDCTALMSRGMRRESLLAATATAPLVSTFRYECSLWDLKEESNRS